MTFFLKNLGIWILGLACQFLAALYPAFAAFGPIGGMLLSAAQMGAALNGSFPKHMAVFALGMACQALAIVLKIPAEAKALLVGASALLLQMSNLAKILQGLGLQGAGAVVAGTPPAKPQPPGLFAQFDGDAGATPSSERRTPTTQPLGPR